MFVSATLPSLPGLDLVAGGYMRGKKMAEEAVERCFPNTGVILRPWVIYGDRWVCGGDTGVCLVSCASAASG